MTVANSPYLNVHVPLFPVSDLKRERKGERAKRHVLQFQGIVLAVIRNSEWTGGTLGVHGISTISLGPPGLDGISSLLVVSSVLLIAGLVASALLGRTKWSAALQAVRDDELAACSAGVNPKALRLQSFVVSALYIGVAGSLFAVHLRFIDTSSFTIEESVFLLLALVCGGTCNTLGPLAGAIFAIALPEWLRFIDMPAVYAAGLRNVVFAVVVIALMRVRPQGIAGRYSLD